MSFIPYANWEAVVLVLIAFFWYQSRQEAKLYLAHGEQQKLKEQLDESNEKLQLYEYVIQEVKIEEQYELSDKRHPEMYTEEKLPLIGTPLTPGWRSDCKPKPEFEKQIELSREVFVTQMIALQAKYKNCLQPGAYTEHTDQNFWLWFEPNYKHPYYYVSHFVKTGRDDWSPPDLD